ncbi:MAG: hypothetical protein WC670_00985 [Pseudolabrys sp.]|jgi:hypothetical protein
MAIATRAAAFHGIAANDHAKPGLLRRLLNSIFETRQHAAQREVDSYVARSGGRFTDSIEREIGNRILDSGWRYR